MWFILLDNGILIKHSDEMDHGRDVVLSADLMSMEVPSSTDKRDGGGGDVPPCVAPTGHLVISDLGLEEFGILGGGSSTSGEPRLKSTYDRGAEWRRPRNREHSRGR